MQIDHRIITGLAWAGALLVVAIPAADFALSRFAGPPAPQVAVIEERPEAEAPVPTPVVPPAARPGTPAPEAAAPAASDPVVTSAAARPVSGEDAVDAYLRSGRSLPGYISNGEGLAAGPEPDVVPESAPAPETAAASEPEPPVRPEPPVTAPAPVVAMPTPLSERPPSVASVQPAPSAPPALVVDTPAPVVTAEDLEDWETGPLSDFLANRQGQGNRAPADYDYDPDGFFLDEGPNARRVQRFPRAYEDDFYPFGR